MTIASSEYLNRRPRSLIQAVRDISAKRDLPIWVWDELLCPRRDNVVSLADRRLRNNATAVGAWQGPGSAA